MEGKDIIFIDSNYWIYLFDKGTPEHPYIKEHFNLIYNSNELAVNVVVMIEVMHYLVKRLGATLAKEKWDIFSSMELINDDLTYNNLDDIFNELSKYSHLGIGGRDSTILSFLFRAKIDTICTHDGSFKKVPNLKVIDPIPDGI